jgi:hypothetical protein
VAGVPRRCAPQGGPSRAGRGSGLGAGLIANGGQVVQHPLKAGPRSPRGREDAEHHNQLRHPSPRGCRRRVGSGHPQPRGLVDDGGQRRARAIRRSRCPRWPSHQLRPSRSHQHVRRAPPHHAGPAARSREPVAHPLHRQAQHRCPGRSRHAGLGNQDDQLRGRQAGACKPSSIWCADRASPASRCSDSPVADFPTIRRDRHCPTR